MNRKHFPTGRLLMLFALFLGLSARAQHRDEQEIRQLLSLQTESWNRGDLRGFMQTYWNSDSLLFIGKSGVKRGWQQALDNYKKGYPDTTAMGLLSFDILQIKRLSDEYYYVVGKWMLQRTIGNLSGHYDLLLRRIKGHWLIISDHSS
ncbi:MAG: YybH family protein [Flavisolibacter sp.]